MASSLTRFNLNRRQYPTDWAGDLSSKTLIASREIASNSSCAGSPPRSDEMRSRHFTILGRVQIQQFYNSTWWCPDMYMSLQWRHNEHGGVSNHQPHDCLLNRLFRRKSKKTSKLRVTGLFAENSLVTGEFTAQKASNEENVTIWWRHHVFALFEWEMDMYKLNFRMALYFD